MNERNDIGGDDIRGDDIGGDDIGGADGERGDPRTARAEMLQKLRRSLRSDGPVLPEIWCAPPAGEGSWHEFARALVEGHGEFHGPIPQSRLHDFLEQQIGADYDMTDAAAELLQPLRSPRGTVSEQGSKQPTSGARELAQQWYVGTALWAIASNGGVAVTSEIAPVRRQWLLCENLLLLVAADALLQDLDELYERIDATAGGYLTLVCGPSKTADIEQTLVTGAHGPRRLIVTAVSEN